MKKVFAILAAALVMTSVQAAEPVEKTVREFLRMSPSDTTACILTGEVKRIRNYDRGNLYLDDGTGCVLIYGVYGGHGRLFPDLDIRTGDTLTVRGYRYLYDRRVIEMKGGMYVCHSAGPDHDNVPKVDEPDKVPTFRGKGLNEFSKWVSAHLKYPEEGLQTDSTATVSFIVGMDGSVQEPKIIKGVSPAMDAEILRVLRKSPRWKPGAVTSHKIRVKYEMPVELHPKSSGPRP